MWHCEDEVRLGSTISTKPVSSSRSRRRTESEIPAQQPDLPCRMRGSPYATGPTTPPTPYSQLSTKGLSNPSLGEIRSRRALRREAAEDRREENVKAGDPRDELAPTPSMHSAAAAASSSNSSTPSSSHLKSSQNRSNFDSPVPLRKRALTSHHSSAVQSPFVPDSSPSYPSLYDRPRRSVPNLNLSNIPARSSSSQLHSPLSTVKRSRDSVITHPPNNPLSPNARKRSEPSVHISQQAVRPDVKATMPSTVTYVEDRTLTGQTNRANGVDKGQEGGDSTPTADTRFKNEDIFLNIARSDPDRRDSLGRSGFRRVGNPDHGFIPIGRPWYSEFATSMLTTRSRIVAT